MEVDLEKMCGKLSLTEQEEEVVVVDEESLDGALGRSEKCLLFKLFTDKQFNKEAFKSTMKRLWRPGKSISIRDVSDNLFIAEFEDPWDKEHVFREGPWAFDKHSVLTNEVDGLQQAHQITFPEELFWVRIHDLPIMARNWKMGHIVGKEVGSVVEVDLEKDALAWGEYLRIRVKLDVTKPLLRGKKVCVGSSNPFWVRFSYEPLPNFRYICGTLGHNHKECNQWRPLMEKFSVSEFPYGPWLRAGNFGDYRGPVHRELWCCVA
ncbi:hypothetical protein F2P56_026987 [Juglans regia]|uniref:DUF4283 domain-containing protein n=2 Tax=Juglans regia TaxID=51240 RepID=A0A833U9Q1_JUGRE|nr:uncharacterized protein LOC108992418 [Juglans regia]KAF5451933.1 hypothetical protein F2P56_026987 [Juglans regia]